MCREITHFPQLDKKAADHRKSTATLITQLQNCYNKSCKYLGIFVVVAADAVVSRRLPSEHQAVVRCIDKGDLTGRVKCLAVDCDAVVAQLTPHHARLHLQNKQMLTNRRSYYY